MAPPVPRRRILVIDDKEEGRALTIGITDVDAKVVHPRHLRLRDLQDTHLILVDYELTEWPERDRLDTPALQPVDGLALAGLLRRHVHDPADDEPPTAIAMLTGKLAALASPLPPNNREHALARLNNLEWVFQKSDAKLLPKIISLLDAVTHLPRWDSSPLEEHGIRLLLAFLGITDTDPALSAIREQVREAMPPIHEHSRWSHGLAVLRWLLHRILPYPTFLLDSYSVAARLRVSHASFLACLASDSDFSRRLQAWQYRGALQDFGGPRWWRAKVDLGLWEVTDGQSSDLTAIRSALRALSAGRLTDSVPSNHPVVCINSNYEPLGDFGDMSECVRIQPDDWPSFADRPWVSIELAKSEPSLRAVVIADDVERLEASHAV